MKFLPTMKTTITNLKETLIEVLLTILTLRVEL